MTEMLTFKQINYVGKAGFGVFRLSKEQLGWKNLDATQPESSVAFVGKDVTEAQWHNSCGKGRGLLRLAFRDGAGVSRFAGFKHEDMKPLQSHLQDNFGVSLVEQPVASEGQSWGDWELTGDDELRVMMNGKLGFEVADLSQVSAAKNELHIEFQQDNLVAPDEEVLHDMRLLIPPQPGVPTAESVKDTLQKHIGGLAGGESIMRFSDVAVVAPRGKHDLEFFPKSFKMHGKTQTYSIKYQSISRLFLLEIPPAGSIAIVIGLDQPLRQGTQMHNFLMFTFNSTVTATISQACADKVQLPVGEEHPVYSAVGKLLKELSGKSVVSSSTDFKQSNPQNETFVACHCKQQPGQLFLLKKSLLFVQKPVIWVRYDDIAGVEFNKNTMRRNSFDLQFRLKSGPGYEFGNMASAVYQPVYDFLENAGIQILNLKDDQQAAARRGSRTAGVEEQAQSKPAGTSAAVPSGGKVAAADDEDDDEEADEDFEDDGSDDGEDEVNGSDESFEADDEPLAKRTRR